MVLFLAYMLFALALICTILTVYNVYCLVSLHVFRKRIEQSLDSSLADYKSKFNIFIWLIKKSHRVRAASSTNELQKAVKKKSKTFTFILILLIVLDLYSAFESYLYALAIYSLNQDFTTVSSVINTVLGKDKDCPCYALCTGNQEDDSKSVYELIFGPDEYNKLIKLMDLTDEEYERFYGKGRYDQELKTMEGDEGYLKGSIKVINTSDDGRAKSEFIRDHINDDMVNAYRDLVSHNPKFRSGDGKNRAKMTQEQLRKDLYALLSDYKVHGRNPNCKCHTANKLVLNKICLGEKHWQPGWTWGKFYYPEPTYDEDGNPIIEDTDTEEEANSKKTKAKDSQYGIELDNGEWFYWYQQRRSCTCAHNVNHKIYGRYGDIYLYNKNSKEADNRAASRGCSTYSAAMAISNALQMEVTPFDLILDLMGGTLTEYKDSFILSGTDNSGLILSVTPPKLIKASFASTVNKKFGRYGLVAKAISLSKENIDAELDRGAFIQLSVSSGFAWYNGSSSHFIVLRKHIGDNYYCLNSAVDDARAIEMMTTPVSWSTLRAHLKNLDGISYWASTQSTEIFSGFAFKAEQFYTKVNFSKGSSTSVNIGGAMLYNSIPWEDDGNWYKLDYDKCNSYINSIMNCTLKIGRINEDSAPRNRGCVNIGGISTHHMTWSPLMAWLDGREDGRMDSSTGWTSGRAAKYHGVAVFEKGGQLYYWPITSGDNMGHMWPNGVAQTMVPGSSSYNSATGKVSIGLWDINWDGKSSGTITVDYKSDILSGDLYTKHIGYSRYKPPAYAASMPDYHCEMELACKSAFESGGYKFKYFIIHKE